MSKRKDDDGGWREKTHFLTGQEDHMIQMDRADPSRKQPKVLLIGRSTSTPVFVVWENSCCDCLITTSAGCIMLKELALTASCVSVVLLEPTLN